MRLLTTKRKAFTLIELLIVTAIIVILTVMVVVNLERAREKSRDVQRKSDLSKIAAALDMYKVDNKVYIISDGWKTAEDFLGLLVTGGFIASIPIDPTPDDTYKYQYKSDTSQFKIIAKSETITNTIDCPASVITEAKLKAGDFYDPATGKCSYFQISTSATALNNW